MCSCLERPVAPFFLKSSVSNLFVLFVLCLGHGKYLQPTCKESNLKWFLCGLWQIILTHSQAFSVTRICFHITQPGCVHHCISPLYYLQNVLAANLHHYWLLQYRPKVKIYCHIYIYKAGSMIIWSEVHIIKVSVSINLSCVGSIHILTTFQFQVDNYVTVQSTEAKVLPIPTDNVCCLYHVTTYQLSLWINSNCN